MSEKEVCEAPSATDQPASENKPTGVDPPVPDKSSSPPDEPKTTCGTEPPVAEQPSPASAAVETDEGAVALEDQPVPKPSGPLGIPSKPKITYIGKDGLEEDITPQPADCIYIAECINCKFVIKKSAAKCIVECCSNVKVELEAPLMSSTLELIDCDGLTLTLNPKDTLQTLTAERCDDIHLHYNEPNALGAIYTVKCPKLLVYFQPPHQEENVIEIVKDEKQYVTKYVDGKFETEVVIREEGGYATTASTAAQRERFRPPQKDLKDIFESYLKNLFTFRIPSEPPSDEEPEDDGKTEEERIKEAKELIASFFSSNIKDEEEKKEIFDSEEEFAEKVDRVVGWMKECKHVIMFTGAGISTSSGIPDYRSGMNTVLKTGPGVWELAANQSDRPEGASVTPIINALPSPTHMAIVQMQKQGMIKFTVSQNIDGLHRRSGLPPSTLSELHGNTNLETCQECKRQYLRDFETREGKLYDHTTSRRCADMACNGVLKDSIINFGEPLPQEELTSALKQGELADLCIVLGSSLRVSPANQVPLNVHERKGKVVICNLQKISSYTPDENTLQVFAKCDDFVEALCKHLNVEIPPFTLYRRARVSTQQGEGSEVKVTVTGLDTDEKDLPYSFIKVAATKYGGESIEVEEEPYMLTLPGNIDEPLPPITVMCRGHYGEPTFQLECPPVGQAQVYRMSYDVLNGKSWVVTKEEEEVAKD